VPYNNVLKINYIFYFSFFIFYFILLLWVDIYALKTFYYLKKKKKLNKNYIKNWKKEKIRIDGMNINKN